MPDKIAATGFSEKILDLWKLTKNNKEITFLALVGIFVAVAGYAYFSQGNQQKFGFFKPHDDEIVEDEQQEEKTITPTDGKLSKSTKVLLDRTINDITTAYPQFKIENIAFLGEGHDSTAFIVNHEFVFRFPKRMSISKELQVEMKLLPLLAQQLKIAVPDFIYFGTQQDTGFQFVGYRKILGNELTKKLFWSLGSVIQTKIVCSLADFLQAVHQFPLATAREAGVRFDDFKASFGEFWEEHQEKILPQLDQINQQKLNMVFARYFENESNFHYTPSLMHADLAPEHIFFDANKEDIAGIIDWGDMVIGDPDFDLMFLYKYYGVEFIKLLLKYYPHQNEARLMEKLHFFHVCDLVETVCESTQPAEQSEAFSELQKALASIALEKPAYSYSRIL